MRSFGKYPAILILFLIYSVVDAQVVTRDTMVSWRHFAYTLDENNGMASYSTTEIVEEEYPGIVLENEYVRLVVLPEFGARIISFFYKPTGHEQFYTNPVGVPYGMNDGNFYYDWLMVFGGVFPTFPEPEHGKSWFLPWKWEISQNTGDAVTLSMELQDTISFPGHPGKFNNGVTEIRCISKVTLHSGKASFELQNSLENTRDQTVPFEYWTCTTLAPGSEPGNTFTPANSEIIVPLEYIYLKDDWWSWMGQAEVAAPQFGDHVFEFMNLATYGNWDDMGIAYAYPALEADYYGVINHENSEGVFRVSDNAGTTPGMKIWTWGAQQGLNADPENFYHNARPYIELWSGFSDQFFQDAYLAAGEVRTWTETYLPVAGMDDASIVNENGALLAEHINPDSEQFRIKVFTTSPGSSFEISAALAGNSTIDLLNIMFIADSHEANEFNIYLEDHFIEDGEYDLQVYITKTDGDTAMQYSLPVTVPLPSHGVPSLEWKLPLVYMLPGNTVKIEFAEGAERTLEVFSLNGQLIDRITTHNKSAIISLNKSGVYIFRLRENDRYFSLKILL